MQISFITLKLTVTFQHYASIFQSCWNICLEILRLNAPCLKVRRVIKCNFGSFLLPWPNYNRRLSSVIYNPAHHFPLTQLWFIMCFYFLNSDAPVTNTVLISNLSNDILFCKESYILLMYPILDLDRSCS